MSSQDFKDLSFGLTNPPSFGSAGELWKDLPDDVLNLQEPWSGSGGPFRPGFGTSASLILENPSLPSFSPAASQEPVEPPSKAARLDDPSSGSVRGPPGTAVQPDAPSAAHFVDGVDPAPRLVKQESLTFQFDGSFGTMVFPELFSSRGSLGPAGALSAEPPAVDEPDPAEALVAELEGRISSQDAELADIAARATSSRPDAHARASTLSQQLAHQLQELDGLRAKFLLPLHLLAACERLTSQLQAQKQRADLYRSELAPGERKPFFTLLITQQPPTQVVFKGRPLDSPFRIKVLAGPLHGEVAADTVKASIADEDNWKSAKPLDNDVARIAKDRSAEFGELKINVSTRMTAIHVRFSCASKDKKTPLAASSPLSNPMIVITNESQWADAEGKLLLLESFGTQNEVSWPQYANMLHRHVLNATAQDIVKTNKCLSAAEFTYIQARYFDNHARVRKARATEFWSWFGQVLTTIRFKRHIRTLWSDGWIYGIASKEEANLLLRDHRPGTFLIRFSDSVPGSFAVAYAAEESSAERVKHYLIKPEEISNNKSLPDFLRDKSMFKYITQYPLRSTERPDSLVIADKDAVLGAFYSKRKMPEPEAHGYQQNLQGLE